MSFVPIGVAVTMVIKDQTEIGVAVGVYGSIRSLAGVLATAIFVTILTSRATSNITHNVAPALAEAGVPLKGIEPLLGALGAGDAAAAAKIPGVTPKLIGLAVVDLQHAYSNAFSLVFLVTIAFGAVSTIAAFFAPQIEKLIKRNCKLNSFASSFAGILQHGVQFRFTLKSLCNCACRGCHLM